MKIKLPTLVLALTLAFGATAQTTNVTLYNIQYSTVDSVGAIPNSAYNGKTVNTGGIVTAVYGSGYYIQTSYAHAWAALFVYDGSHSPSVGDSIALTGSVIEYYNETELQTITSFNIISSGNQARTPATDVSFDSIQRRKYQAMLIRAKDITCLHYNTAQAWYAFYDSTTTKGKPSEDTVDNIIMVTQKYTNGKKYNITGVIHFEYANWIEPRNQADIDSINVTAVQEYANPIANVNVFPNPSNGEFTISVDAPNGVKNVEVSLTDITGRVVYTEQMNITAGKSSLLVNAGNLEKGTYFLQLRNAEYKTVNKVVVE
ncbi:MAG TPA: T9SS type A sorting domain-containing protein [Bacteroidia bacterium]|jgi:hypothetical protein|nr:T9SS type A sorting domain-containing protein [Bacteroidia bacterium]